MNDRNDYRKKGMFVKIFNGCSEEQRHPYFYAGKGIIFNDVRDENIGIFRTTID